MHVQPHLLPPPRPPSTHQKSNTPQIQKQTRATFLFSLLAMMSETAVFLELGLSVFSGEAKNFHPGLIIWTFVLILIGRAINVYPISYLVNRCAGWKGRWIACALGPTGGTPTGDHDRPTNHDTTYQPPTHRKPLCIYALVVI